MDIGVFFFATEYSIRVDELAAALEERGLESLFLCEHTHIPTNRASAFPGGGELPREYAHTFDPFVALSFAAGVTTRLKLGTGICLVPQRDPIVTAKSVASVDRLSNGRFVFGIGGGWNVEEMNNHGADHKTPLQVNARAGAGDEGAMGPRTRPPSMANSSISTRSGATPSHFSGRTRLSSWAARATTLYVASRNTATAGSRAVRGSTPKLTWPGCARRPRPPDAIQRSFRCMCSGQSHSKARWTTSARAAWREPSWVYHRSLVTACFHSSIATPSCRKCGTELHHNTYAWRRSRVSGHGVSQQGPQVVRQFGRKGVVVGPPHGPQSGATMRAIAVSVIETVAATPGADARTTSSRALISASR